MARSSRPIITRARAALRRRPRIARWLRRLVWALQLVPISPLGLATIAASWWSLAHFGKAQGDYVLHAAAILSFAFIAASVLVVSAAALWLSVSLRGTKTLERNLDTGVEFRTGFSLSRLAWWPLVQVDMSWQSPEAVTVTLRPKGGRFEEWATPTRRGRLTEVVRRFYVRDIFGLATVTFRRRVHASIRIAPQTGVAAAAAIRRNVSGEGFSHPAGRPEGELIEMRRYAPGDPLRLVLWKTFARSRRLLVRAPERALCPQPSAVAYFVSGADDEASAATARALLESGQLGPDFLFGADGTERLERTAAGGVEALIDAASASEGASRLSRLFDEVDPTQLGQCVLFVPPHQGPWIDRLRAFAPKLPAPPTVVITVDGPLAPPRSARWVRLLRRTTATHSLLAELPALYDALRPFCAAVRVVHAGSGRLLSHEDLDALRHL